MPCVAADARGVTVQLIMWDGRTSSVMAEFAKALNDGKTAGSYFKVCKGACLGATSGRRQHQASTTPKVLTFSQVNLPGGQVAKNITSIGTGNFSISNAETSFNVWRIIPNNATMYNAASAYIAKMKVRQGPAHQEGHAGRGRRHDHVPLSRRSPTLPIFSSISSRPPPARGPRRPSGLLSTSGPLARKPIADRLAVLKRAGCDVKVIVNYDSDLLDASVLTVLLRARIPVYNAHKIGKIHTHAKDLYISALVGGRQQNLVVSGSLNLTRGSLYANDEAGYKINSAAAFDRYNALWNICGDRMRTGTSGPVTGPTRARDDRISRRSR